MMDVMLRSKDRATMEKAMVRFGILLEVTDEEKYQKALDAREPNDEGEFEEIDVPTKLVPAKGVHIKWDIPIWKVTPTFSPKGKPLVKGIRDKRFHADLRVVSPATDTIHEESGLPAVEYVLSLWREIGTDGVPNKNEKTKRFYGVELIDPETVTTPAHRFL